MEDAKGKASALKKGEKAEPADSELKGLEGVVGDAIRAHLKSKGINDTNLSISRQGSLIVVGPNGKRHTQFFDPSNGVNAPAIANMIS